MSNFRRALEKSKPSALLYPLLMRVLTLSDAYHTETHEAFEALILLLEFCSHFISADDRFILAFAVATICADTSRALVHLHEVMIFHCCMHAINHAELAVVHVLTHLSALTASEAKVVLKALTRSVELVANAVQLTR